MHSWFDSLKEKKNFIMFFSQVCLNIYKCLNIVGIIKVKFLFCLCPKALSCEGSYGENINRIFFPIHLVYIVIPKLISVTSAG